MKTKNTKYILADDFEFITPDEILADKDLEANPELREEYILQDKLYHRTYIINESIFNFLQYFKTSISFDSLLEQLGIDQEDTASISHIQNFFVGLKKKGVIVTEEDNEKIRIEMEIQDTMPDIKVKDYTTLKVFKQDFNMWVGLVKTADEAKQFVVKKLLLDSITSKKQQAAYKQEFNQEFMIMKEINDHPAICKLFNYDDENGEAEMEYIEGDSLRRYIKEKQPSLKKRIELVDSLLDAFAYIQTKNVVHGDIHASNFKIDKSENLKILDFGMSNHLELEDNEVLKRGGAYFYIPPERVSKEPFKILNNKKTDYYAENYQLGIIIYFIFYGKNPFEGLTWKILSKDIQEKEIIFEKTTSSGEIIPAKLLDILSKTLEKDPKSRFADAKKLYEAWSQTTK